MNVIVISSAASISENVAQSQSRQTHAPHVHSYARDKTHKNTLKTLSIDIITSITGGLFRSDRLLLLYPIVHVVYPTHTHTHTP